jgi:cation transport regulator ChaC
MRGQDMHDIATSTGSDKGVEPELWARLQWDSDLWIFACGDRMAEPGFPFCEAAPARLDDGGASLGGIAYRVPAVDVPAALDDLSRRVRRNRGYGLQEIEVDTPSGRVTAYALGKRSHDVGQRKAA